MLGSMSFIGFAYYLHLAREHLIKQWQETLRATFLDGIWIPVPDSYTLDWIELRQPITRFDRLLAAQSTVPTERLYHIWVEVTDRRMAHYGCPWRVVTVEPALTHREACTVLSKHTQYSWRRMWLVEVGSAEERRLIAQNAAYWAECVPVGTSAQGKRGRP